MSSGWRIFGMFARGPAHLGWLFIRGANQVNCRWLLGAALNFAGWKLEYRG